MLTKADDFPIHQTPEPIAYSGTDRNFYDRYFFNGYTRSGDVFFAAALGVYPHLNIMDAAFSVVIDGQQHHLNASRVFHMERLDTSVGPIAIQVVEPLSVLRILVDENEFGLSADLTFTLRAPAIEEPRFVRRNGPRMFMDYTRLTQNGTWSGWINLGGQKIDVTPDAYRGTRDRSWGVRPVGAGDSQPVQPPAPAQFYWLWAPLNFDHGISLYHLNADADGMAWNTNAVLCAADPEATAIEMAACASDVTFASGSRHAASAHLRFTDHDGGTTVIDLKAKWNFYMIGLGYGNPDWSHGTYVGENEVGYRSFNLSDIKASVPPHLHIQAFVEATMIDAEGIERQGEGVLEQLIIGPHAPSGFVDILDMAP